jgi:hypothetical protein
MLLLLMSEFSYYRTTYTETHLAVDTAMASSDDESIIVDTHITFFHAPYVINRTRVAEEWQW